MGIPLSTVSFYTKQLTPLDLNELGAAALRAAFGGYADEQKPSQESVALWVKEQSRRFNTANFSYDPAHFRRFAGDGSLPRSRYYTIADDASGADGGTLRCELREYYNADAAGVVQIYDTTLPSDAANLARFSLPPGPAIVLAFLPVRGKANDFAVAQGASGKGYLAHLPVRVEKRTWKRIVDLREPRAAEQFARMLSRLEWNRRGQDEGVPPPAAGGQFRTRAPDLA